MPGPDQSGLALSISQTIQAASYVRDNVLPTNRVRPPRDKGQFDAGILAGVFYSPASVPLLQDCGGFNCIIELSAATCRQQAEAALRPTPLLHQLTISALGSLLASAASGGPLDPSEILRGSSARRTMAGSASPWRRAP